VTEVDAKAELDLDTPSTNCDTIIEATDAGTDGNSITILFVDGSLVDDGELTRDGTDFTFTFKHNVTTVADFEAAVAALAGDDDLIAVKTAGTAGNTLVTTDDEFVATPLAGGTTEANPISRRFAGPEGDNGLWTVHSIIGGSPTGSIKFYHSNLPDPDPDTTADWVLLSALNITLAGSALNSFTKQDGYLAAWVMVRIELTSGSGTAAVWYQTGE
jgi:hypothetical protein